MYSTFSLMYVKGKIKMPESVIFFTNHIIKILANQNLIHFSLNFHLMAQVIHHLMDLIT